MCGREATAFVAHPSGATVRLERYDARLHADVVKAIPLDLRTRAVLGPRQRTTSSQRVITRMLVQVWANVIVHSFLLQRN